MPSQVCIVTGASGGLGAETTRRLLEADAEVIMACRSMSTCERVKSEICTRVRSSNPNAECKCACMQLDLENSQSVKEFAQKVAVLHPGNIKVLVNNAGVMGVSTKQGPERHVLINHLGHFLLTRLLMPHLHPYARIVNVSSRAHLAGWKLRRALDADRRSSAHSAGSAASPHTSFPPLPGFWFWDYAYSKLCNILFTQELIRRFKQQGSSITAYSISPGLVKTDIFAGPPILKPLLPIIYFFSQPPEVGAAGIVNAALNPALEGQSVLYMHNSKDTKPSRDAQDPDLARRLWDASSRHFELPTDL